jgi:hypothetical protein
MGGTNEVNDEREKSVTRVIASRYQNSNKKEKGKILKEFIELTGYTRSYASYLLGSHGKRLRITSSVVIVGDVRKKTKRNRDKIYDSRACFKTSVCCHSEPRKWRRISVLRPFALLRATYLGDFEMTSRILDALKKMR